jgi:hypothetical protein
MFNQISKLLRKGRAAQKKIRRERGRRETNKNKKATQTRINKKKKSRINKKNPSSILGSIFLRYALRGGLGTLCSHQIIKSERTLRSAVKKKIMREAGLEDGEML